MSLRGGLLADETRYVCKGQLLTGLAYTHNDLV